MAKMSNLYLLAYNSLQAIGWVISLSKILIDCASTKSLSGAYFSAGELICLLQTLSFLEVFHGAIGIVPSGALLPLMQWGGRTHFLLAIVRQINELQEQPAVFVTFVAWCLSEVIRYPQYALSCLGSSQSTLTYLRYTAFIALYPLGFLGEMLLMYKALPFIKTRNLYANSFSGLPFTYYNFVTIIDELELKLLYSNLELESVRAQANEEKIKNKDYTLQLLQLLKTVSKERDEAKHQLQNLLSKIMLPKAHPSITESNSFSDSSPTSSFFDPVASSPNLSSLNEPLGQDFHDEGNLAIEMVAEGRALPEKGKLLQAVLEAGPLLQTLMVAGPLPRWRNPPPHQPFELPPFCINRGSDVSFVPKLLDSSFVEMNYGSSQMMSTSSMVNFGSETNGNNYGFSGKRQRFQ